MRGPVALQETHWSEEQATKVTTLIPGARAIATPATTKNTHPSGGVAVILPIGYEVISQQTVLPGQILAAQVRIRGATVRIVTIYLHPETVQSNMKTLLKYLQTIDLREWTFLLGDFNRADQHCPDQWQSLLEEYGYTDGHPRHLPPFGHTAVKQTSIESCCPPLSRRTCSYSTALA